MCRLSGSLHLQPLAGNLGCVELPNNVIKLVGKDKKEMFKERIGISKVLSEWHSVGALSHGASTVCARFKGFWTFNHILLSGPQKHITKPHIHNQKCLEITILNSLEVSERMLFTFGGGFWIDAVNSWCMPLLPWTMRGAHCCGSFVYNNLMHMQSQLL